jgi:hypothetical protein
MLTCVVGRHCAQVIVELVPPVVCRLETMLLEELVQQGEKHWIVVGKHKQVYCQQICARLKNKILNQ